MTNAENSISMNRKGVLRFQTRRLKTVESCASESPKSAGPRDGNSIRVQRTQQQRCSHDSNAINGVREHCSLSREAPRSKHGRQAHLSKSDATVSYSLPPPAQQDHVSSPCPFRALTSGVADPEPWAPDGGGIAYGSCGVDNRAMKRAGSVFVAAISTF